MTLTQKECELLKDLQSQEQLCVEKYKKYAQTAKSCELSALLSDIQTTEQHHLDTVNTMMAGNVPSVPSGPLSANNAHCAAWNGYKDENDRKDDAFLCQDLLTTEKHASALYDTCVFEFQNPDARKVLNHIQAEEQQHGEQLYAYMKANQMYS